MKLISINLARALWLFYVNDLNPRGKSIEHNLMAEICGRYSFVNFPTPEDIVKAQETGAALILQNGIFNAPSGNEVAVGLHLYKDGMFADTRSSTQDSEAFLIDLLEWLRDDLGLEDHNQINIRKFHASEVYVSLDKSLNMINPKFAEFAQILGESIKTPYRNIQFETAALGFWIDPDVKHVHVPFRIERQEGAGFSSERYYSIAPLETEKHLEVLELLEQTMSE